MIKMDVEIEQEGGQYFRNMVKNPNWGKSLEYSEEGRKIKTPSTISSYKGSLNAEMD